MKSINENRKLFDGYKNFKPGIIYDHCPFNKCRT